MPTDDYETLYQSPSTSPTSDNLLSPSTTYPPELYSYSYQYTMDQRRMANSNHNASTSPSMAGYQSTPISIPMPLPLPLPLPLSSPLIQHQMGQMAIDPDHDYHNQYHSPNPNHSHNLTPNNPNQINNIFYPYSYPYSYSMPPSQSHLSHTYQPNVLAVSPHEVFGQDPILSSPRFTGLHSVYPLSGTNSLLASPSAQPLSLEEQQQQQQQSQTQGQSQSQNLSQRYHPLQQTTSNTEWKRQPSTNHRSNPSGLLSLSTQSTPLTRAPASIPIYGYTDRDQDLDNDDDEHDNDIDIDLDRAVPHHAESNVKSKRATQACEACKRRKIKCKAVRPGTTCPYCINKNYECKWAPQKNKSRVGVVSLDAEEGDEGVGAGTGNANGAKNLHPNTTNANARNSHGNGTGRPRKVANVTTSASDNSDLDAEGDPDDMYITSSVPQGESMDMVISDDEDDDADADVVDEKDGEYGVKPKRPPPIAAAVAPAQAKGKSTRSMSATNKRFKSTTRNSGSEDNVPLVVGGNALGVQLDGASVPATVAAMAKPPSTGIWESYAPRPRRSRAVTGPTGSSSAASRRRGAAATATAAAAIKASVITNTSHVSPPRATPPPAHGLTHSLSTPYLSLPQTMSSAAQPIPLPLQTYTPVQYITGLATPLTAETDTVCLPPMYGPPTATPATATATATATSSRTSQQRQHGEIDHLGPSLSPNPYPHPHPNPSSTHSTPDISRVTSSVLSTSSVLASTLAPNQSLHSSTAGISDTPDLVPPRWTGSGSESTSASASTTSEQLYTSLSGLSGIPGTAGAGSGAGNDRWGQGYFVNYAGTGPQSGLTGQTRAGEQNPYFPPYPAIATSTATAATTAAGRNYGLGLPQFGRPQGQNQLGLQLQHHSQFQSHPEYPHAHHQQQQQQLPPPHHQNPYINQAFSSTLMQSRSESQSSQGYTSLSKSQSKSQETSDKEGQREGQGDRSSHRSSHGFGYAHDQEYQNDYEEDNDYSTSERKVPSLGTLGPVSGAGHGAEYDEENLEWLGLGLGLGFGGHVSGGGEGNAAA